MIGAFPIIGCFQPDVVLVFLKVTYDALGVPSVALGKGVEEVTDDNTGLFTVTTKFPWRELVGGGFLALSASASGLTAQVADYTVADRTVQIRIANAGGSAADPGNGDGAYLTLAFGCGGATPL
jgi:hypothetical protein